MEEGERIVVKSLVRRNRKKMRRVSLGTNEAVIDFACMGYIS